MVILKTVKVAIQNKTKTIQGVSPSNLSQGSIKLVYSGCSKDDLKEIRVKNCKFTEQMIFPKYPRFHL